MTSTTIPTTVGVAVARAEQATKIYGAGDAAVRALDGVTIEFPAGRFTAIMGPSGSGKSTLMHCVAGLDNLTSGHAYIGGVDPRSLSDKQLTSPRRDPIRVVVPTLHPLPT